MNIRYLQKELFAAYRELLHPCDRWIDNQCLDLLGKNNLLFKGEPVVIGETNDPDIMKWMYSVQENYDYYVEKVNSRNEMNDE